MAESSKHLPDLAPLAQAAVLNLSPNELEMFEATFPKRKRSTFWMVILAIFLPVQLFFLDKIGLGIAFVLTGGGFGVWYIVEWFLTPRRVREYNSAQALKTIQEISVARGE